MGHDAVLPASSPERQNVSIPRYGPTEDIWEVMDELPTGVPLFTGTRRADRTVELRDEKSSRWEWRPSTAGTA